jgi:hypothetical protein
VRWGAETDGVTHVTARRGCVGAYVCLQTPPATGIDQVALPGSRKS